MKKMIALLGATLICASTMTGCGLFENDESSNNTQEQLTATETTPATDTSTTTEFTTTTCETTTTATETTQDNSEAEALTHVQENSIAWLNYLAMLSQEINESQHSKMFLEEAYAAIINNTNPANVNEQTESYLMDLLDIIQKYRMIETKRERLQYLYEQNQARALRSASTGYNMLCTRTLTGDHTRFGDSYRRLIWEISA